jgi:peptidoglycan-associated lipoprotein
MEQITEAGRAWRLALVSVAVAVLVAGCATTASYRPEIDSMKADLAEAKAAGAETLAPEEYAHAEACLDWLTHEATEFHPFADPHARNFIGKCRAAFAALKSSLAAARQAKIPVEPVSPPQAPKPEAAPSSAPTAVTPPAPGAGAADAGAGREKESPLQDVFFDFDKSLIRPDAKKSLEENVRWLRANPSAKILIEGHCDERGTREYNLALGQRRAKSAQDHLVAAGINAKRIRTISYGKERPFALGHDESAWKWNRRAHFVLQ